MTDTEYKYDHERPVRIDIYVDGSWLNKGKSNTTEAGGWGAAVLETYANGQQEIWTPSGPTGEAISSSSGAEAYAAISGLKAVKIRQEQRAGEPNTPTIVLHTDQIGWQNYIDKVRKRADLAPKNTDSGNAMKEMADLVIAMDIKVEYAGHHKGQAGQYSNAKSTDDPLMAIPDQLASRAAWRERLDKQDGVVHFGPDTVTASSPEERDNLVNRMYPITPTKRER